MKTYDIKEASKILQYNEEYLRRLIKTGKIKAVKVGRKWIIKEETIKELLKGYVDAVKYWQSIKKYDGKRKRGIK